MVAVSRLMPWNWFRAAKPERPSASAIANVAARMMLRARYDAAQTNSENRKHWAAADDLSAVAANSAAVRHTLRKRSRYEVANNSYARGMVLTLANDVVGTGPRLQLLTSDAKANKRIQKSFSKWAKKVGLARKLRTMRMARCQDGEAFAMLVTNKRLNHPIKLDLRLIEADQICDPYLSAKNDRVLDGIEYDEDDNAVAYYITRHPGGSIGSRDFAESKRVDAESVIHWFREDRPGQVRGIPELTAALPLFAQLRRFTLAVLAAAEVAADFSVLLESDLPANQGDIYAEGNEFEELDIAKRMMMTLPVGTKAKQLEAEQPTTTYREFKGEILNEAARCINMPFNIAAGNSSGYNYSSGRLDWQTYFRAIGIDQCDCEEVVLDRIFAAWLDEAALVPGLLPESLKIEDIEHAWFWDAPEHVDPSKEADAQATRLQNQTTTLADEWAAKGWDWEEKLEQLAREKKKLDTLGLSVKDIKAEVDVAKLITALMSRVEELEASLAV